MRNVFPCYLVQVLLVLLLFNLSVSVDTRDPGACPEPTKVTWKIGVPSAFAWGVSGLDAGDCECDCEKCEGVSPPTAEGPSASPVNATAATCSSVRSIMSVGQRPDSRLPGITIAA